MTISGTDPSSPKTPAATPSGEALRDDVTNPLRVGLFSACSESQLRRLNSIVQQVEVAADEVICRQGEPSEAFHVVLTGRVRLSLDGNAVYTCRPGDFFGEIAMLAEKPRMLSAVAAATSTVGIIERADFEDLLIDMPVLARSLLRTMAVHMWMALTAALPSVRGVRGDPEA